MNRRVHWVGVALAAMLTVASVCLAAESGPVPGKGGVGGQIGGSTFRLDGAIGQSWFGDYSAGARPRFAFSGQFRYIARPWLRWQVSPGFTWSGYKGSERAPFQDPRFPEDRDKSDYLVALVPVSAQVQVMMKRGAWLYHVGAGPGVYRVWVQNHREVLKDPVTFKLHRGLYPGASGQFGAELFLKNMPNTSVEAALAGHLAFAQRDEQFVSGLNSNLFALEARIGANYYFSITEKKPQEGALPSSQP